MSGQWNKEEPKLLPDIFQRAKITIPKSDGCQWTINVRNKPWYALKKAVLRNSEFPDKYIPVCGVCGSANTYLIYQKRVFHQEPSSTFEFACRDCKKVTEYCFSCS
jgi:hypothetical protein